VPGARLVGVSPQLGPGGGHTFHIRAPGAAPRAARGCASGMCARAPAGPSACWDPSPQGGAPTLPRPERVPALPMPTNPQARTCSSARSSPS
jgi:hypothetical protein